MNNEKKQTLVNVLNLHFPVANSLYNWRLNKMEDDFNHMVRIARRDVNGNKTIENALTGIKGVGNALSRAISIAMGFDLDQKMGYL
jgi:hypothetical protein